MQHVGIQGFLIVKFPVLSPALPRIGEKRNVRKKGCGRRYAPPQPFFRFFSIVAQHKNFDFEKALLFEETACQ